MIKPIHILILAVCSAVSARIGLSETRPAGYGLENNTEVMINRQGMAQQDLSIRGSSYMDTGMSLNGLNLKTPLSAHYNAELPVYAPLLSDTKAQSGLNNVSGHLMGTASMRILPLPTGSHAAFGLGTDERYRASIFSCTEHVGGYLEWEKARRIDYDANDLSRITGGAFVQQVYNDWQFDILSAGQQKDYGAQGYYGIPAKVYAEEETDDTLLIASALKGDLAGAFIRAGFSLRGIESEYRIPSAAFMSDDASWHGAVMIEGRTLEIQQMALNMRGDLEHERMSGDIGNHFRTRGSVLLLPEAHLDRITLKAGLNSVFQSDESPEWLPQGGIDFHVTDNTTLYCAYSETVMQPDYQSLYYTDPYRIGNPDLRLQHSHTTELGLHQFLSAELDWRIGVFQRRQENARDWVRPTAADTTWTVTDLGTLDVTGFDALINYLAMDAFKIGLYYQWISKDEYDFHAGLYELDYPEHLLVLSGFWQIAPGLQLFGKQDLFCQTDNKVRNSNDFGAEASLGLHYDPRFAKNVRLSLLAENLWDSDFQPIPGLKPRPLSISTGITVAW